MTSECILWEGYIRPDGYGQVTRNHKNGLAHRASWVASCGPIPKGMCVLHKCDVRACVNPQHLFLGTHADNVHDMDAKGRRVNPGVDACERMSKARKGIERPPHIQAQLRIMNVGREFSQEARRNMSLGQQKRYAIS